MVANHRIRTIRPSILKGFVQNNRIQRWQDVFPKRQRSKYYAKIGNPTLLHETDPDVTQWPKSSDLFNKYRIHLQQREIHALWFSYSSNATYFWLQHLTWNFRAVYGEYPGIDARFTCQKWNIRHNGKIKPTKQLKKLHVNIPCNITKILHYDNVSNV